MAMKCSKNLLAMSWYIGSRWANMRLISNMMEQKKPIHAEASACNNIAYIRHHNNNNDSKEMIYMPKF